MAPEPEDIKVEFSQTGTNGTADTFVMQNVVDLATASYTITNFIVGEDKVQLSGFGITSGAYAYNSNLDMNNGIYYYSS